MADPQQGSPEQFFDKLTQILYGSGSSGDTVSLADYYLAAIYGDWVLGGENYTIVTSSFSIANYLAFALGTLIFFAAVIGGIVKTAGQGEPMGRQWGDKFISYKMAIGAMMMMPLMVDFNVSISQRLSVEILRIGSRAADFTWAGTIRNATVNLGAFDSAPMFMEASKELYKATHCAMAMNHHDGDRTSDRKSAPVLTYRMSYRSNSGAGGGDLVRIGRRTIGHFMREESTQGNWQKFAGRASDEIKSRLSSGTLTAIAFGRDGACGVYNFPAIKKTGARGTGPQEVPSAYDSEGNYQVNSGIIHEVKKDLEVLATKNMATPIANMVENSIRLAAYSIASNPVTRGSGAQYMDKIMSEGIGRSNEYAATIAAPAMRLSESQARFIQEANDALDSALTAKQDRGSSWQDEIVKATTTRGWLYAGAWIMQLGRITQIPMEVASRMVSVNAATANLACDKAFWEFFKSDTDCQEVQDVIRIPAILLETLSESDPSRGDPTPACGYRESCTAEEVSVFSSSHLAQLMLRTIMFAGMANNSPFTDDWASNNPQQSGDGKTLLGVNRELMSEAGVVRDSFSLRDMSGLTNPFEALIQFGHGLMNISHVMEFMMLPPIKFAKAMSEEAADDAPALLKAFPILAKIKLDPIVLRLHMAAALFIALGASLAYILPILPMVRWLGPTIGWLVMSAEFILVPPFAMMLLIIPEGSGIIGTQLNAVIRYLAAGLLRPTLSVLALIASFILAYVCFGFFNGFFWESFAINTDSSLFEVVLIVYLYGFLAYQIIDKLMQLCIMLVKDVLRWMASGEPFADATFGGISINPSEIGSALVANMDAVAKRAQTNAQAGK